MSIFVRALNSAANQNGAVVTSYDSQTNVGEVAVEANQKSENHSVGAFQRFFKSQVSGSIMLLNSYIMTW